MNYNQSTIILTQNDYYNDIINSIALLKSSSGSYQYNGILTITPQILEINLTEESSLMGESSITQLSPLKITINYLSEYIAVLIIFPVIFSIGIVLVDYRVLQYHKQKKFE